MRALVTAVLVATLTIGATGVALAGDGAGEDTGPKHVTRVTGTRAYGFHVVWSDGRQWWTPTLSETLAECTAYDRRTRAARCKARARARYRWMGIVKRSVRHAR